MTIYNHTPYTYLIGWSKLDRWYYGVRFAKGCHPSDLWVTYFTSSKYVKQFISIHGKPDVIEVRHTFDNLTAAKIWEQKVLIKMRVVSSERWLNKTAGGRDFSHANCKHSLEARAKMSVAKKGHIPYNKGKKLSDEHRRKISIAQTGKHRKLSDEARIKIANSKRGKKLKPHTDETRLKISIANRGKKLSEEHKNKLRGRKVSEETRLKMSESQKGKPKHKQTDETRLKISIAMKGRKLSEEHRIKIGDVHRGKTVSEETKNKMRGPRIRHV